MKNLFLFSKKYDTIKRNLTEKNFFVFQRGGAHREKNVPGTERVCHGMGDEGRDRRFR